MTTKDKEWTLGSERKPLTNINFARDNPYSSYLADEIESIIERGEYTHDYPKLCEKTHHYVFVYGTLKKDFRNSKLLLGSPLVGCGYTQTDRFFLAYFKKGRFPVALFDNRPDQRARIYGELYQVETSRMLDLDNLESNGQMYKRHELSILVFDSMGEAKSYRAWVYVGVKDFWTERVDKLMAGRKVKPNNNTPPYWLYTVNEQ